MTPKQSKAARILLDWQAKELAHHAGVSAATVVNFEKHGATLRGDVHDKILGAYLRAGVRFQGEVGVTAKAETSQIIEGEDSVAQLWKLILDAFEGHDSGEVLITHVDEKRALKQSNADLEQHLENLKEAGITERLLSCEGDTFFLAPPHCYRWLSKEVFSAGRSTYVFNGCVAVQFWHNNVILFVRNKKVYTSEKNRFETLWDSALIPTLFGDKNPSEGQK